MDPEKNGAQKSAALTRRLRSELMKEVVAALIRSGDRFLICRRPAHKMCGSMWEFAGGKVETGETGADAIAREIREELDIEIAAEEPIAEATQHYAEFDVHLTLYRCRLLSGTPKLLEHSEFRWITAEEAGEYEFCPADVQLLGQLGMLK